jgi:hypothetical protein
MPTPPNTRTPAPNGLASWLRRRLRLGLALPVILSVMLSGCDWLGVESAANLVARKEAEGRALGAACRESGRGLERCFAQHKRADKAAVFTGWREMNDYMRDNKMTAAQSSDAEALTTATAQPGSTDAKAAPTGPRP